MKEIDFLPEWYKSGRRRQVNYRLQYFILSGAFAVMMVWNFVSANSLSNVQAKYLQMETVQAQSEKVSIKLEDFKKKIAMLHEKEKLLDSIDSKIIVSNILAEISYLVGDRVVLSRVELISEKIPEKENRNKSLQSVSAVRTSSLSFGNNTDAQIGNLRFRILIAGVAANGSDVASFLCRLEDSPYFNHVDLSFTKDAEVKTAKKAAKNPQQDTASDIPADQKVNSGTGNNIQVSEFEISCYLSNYRQ